MKIKIDAKGSLHLERAGELKIAICPFTYTTECLPCGDWCALFTNEKAHITLCHMAYGCLIEDFTDERAK